MTAQEMKAAHAVEDARKALKRASHWLGVAHRNRRFSELAAGDSADAAAAEELLAGAGAALAEADDAVGRRRADRPRHGGTVRVAPGQGDMADKPHPLGQGHMRANGAVGTDIDISSQPRTVLDDGGRVDARAHWSPSSSDVVFSGSGSPGMR